MNIEKVWIRLNEYHQNKMIESDMPEVGGLYLKEYKVKNLNEYRNVTKRNEDLYKGHLVLVNTQYPWHFLQEHALTNVSLVKNDNYKVLDKKMRLDKEMLEKLHNMLNTFKEYSGKQDIILTSGYRSLHEQQEILKEKMALYGETEASKWAMRPGYSEHHTGYAVDISICTQQGNYIRYRGQDEYGWINENCHKYGFIRRYPGDKKEITGVYNEEWHYRYIGVPHSYIVTAKNYCFEEYIDYLRQYTVDKKHLQVKCLDGEFEIYFVPANCEKGETSIPIPQNGKTSIQGNNVDGYIVTVKRVNK